MPTILYIACSFSSLSFRIFTLPNMMTLEKSDVNLSLLTSSIPTTLKDTLSSLDIQSNL